MIKINIIAVGKVKEKYFSLGIEEYKKRLSRFCDFNIIEIEEENYSKADDGTIALIKQKEGERILKKLSGYTVATAIEGKELSSEKFAELIEKTSATHSAINFVIGGSYGLSDGVKQKADMLLSVSDMTFPHTLFRLMLTEQIYRAFCILNGVAYHK